jgi:hypothetical protein
LVTDEATINEFLRAYPSPKETIRKIGGAIDKSRERNLCAPRGVSGLEERIKDLGG